MYTSRLKKSHIKTNLLNRATFKRYRIFKVVIRNRDTRLHLEACRRM